MSVADDYTTLGTEYMVPTPSILPINAAPIDSSFKNAAQESPEGSDDLGPNRPLHRLSEVRQQQGISIRSAARRMGVPMSQVRREEEPLSNLSLADLVRWQKALEVPLVDLLIDEDSPISSPVISRARWLRMMKTVKALLEASPSSSITRMAEMLEGQVLEVMPELQDVGAWHSVGQRRSQDEQGRIAEQIVPSSFARDVMR